MGRARGRDSECRRMGQRETGDKIRAGKPEVYTFCHSTYQSQRFLREGEMEAIEMLSCSEGGGGGGEGEDYGRPLVWGLSGAKNLAIGPLLPPSACEIQCTWLTIDGISCTGNNVN